MHSIFYFLIFVIAGKSWTLLRLITIKNILNLTIRPTTSTQNQAQDQDNSMFVDVAATSPKGISFHLIHPLLDELPGQDWKDDLRLERNCKYSIDRPFEEVPPEDEDPEKILKEKVNPHKRNATELLAK